MHDATVDDDALLADSSEDSLGPDAAGSWVAPATPATLADAYVKATNTDGADQFGRAVALSADGTTLAVSAPDEQSGVAGMPDDDSMVYAGAVYVYTWTQSGWAPQAYVKPVTPSTGDHFGIDVALSGDGNTLVVGVPYDDKCTTGVDGIYIGGTCGDSGVVFVFRRSGSTWTQQSYIKPSNTKWSGAFGQSVAISRDGGTIAVGATGDNSDGTGVDGTQNNYNAYNSGAVLLFSKTSSSWIQTAYIKARNSADGDGFGASVALSAQGEVLAVGASGEDSMATGIGGSELDNSFSGAGAAYVFRRTGSTWSQEAYVKASNTNQGDAFGASVSLSASGDTMAVGAVGERSGNPNDPSDNTQISAGAVYIFTKASVWSQQAYVKRAAPFNADHFGRSIALAVDGSRLVVGASGDDKDGQGIDPVSTGVLDGSGAVEMYDRVGMSWMRTHLVKATNSGASDIFGCSVAITADGSAIAVGAANEASAATGVDGNQNDNTKPLSGAAYVYKLP
jgi:trimeric autotransporter adhesin